jgi:hypothetical protein
MLSTLRTVATVTIHQALVFIHLHTRGFIFVEGATDLLVFDGVDAVVVEYCGDGELGFDFLY